MRRKLIKDEGGNLVGVTVYNPEDRRYVLDLRTTDGRLWAIPDDLSVAPWHFWHALAQSILNLTTYHGLDKTEVEDE